MFNDACVCGFVGIPFILLFPIIPDRMNLFMVFWIWFSHFFCPLMYSSLHFFPLDFGYFEFFDVVRIPMVTIRYDCFHSSTAMCFEWSVESVYYAFFDVEWAGATTLRAAVT